MKEEVLKRMTCSYENKSQKFRYKPKRKFDLQYSQAYSARSELMRPKLIEAAKKKWKSDIKPLADLISEENCVIVGTLFRKMELQPGMLKEICNDENVLPLPESEKYSSDEDVVILEESQQRIQLIGDIDLSKCVTGISIAAYGYEADGKFNVKEITFAAIPEYSNISIDEALQKGEDRYVLFISGLGVGGNDESLFKLQLLIDIVTGNLGDTQDNEMYSKVCRVVIAGNSLSKDTQDKETEKLAKYLSRNAQAKSVLAVKNLDDMMVQLGSSVPVDIMPGEYDPTNQFLPQQPLHKCMLPKASAYSSVQSVTNPYKAVVGGVKLLGTSGQNVTNIYQFSGFNDRLDILESTLKAGHISPTCPDTLSSYPYYDEDPFILQDCPDIYFAGNQPKFAFKEIEINGCKSLMLLVPAFDISSSGVLVNLRDLSCQPISVGTML